MSKKRKYTFYEFIFDFTCFFPVLLLLSFIIGRIIYEGI